MMPDDKLPFMWFRDQLDPRGCSLPTWPQPMYSFLVSQPTIAQSTIEDLKLELEHPFPLRYWVSRATVWDRPQPSKNTYEGMFARIQVEACIDGNWVLIDGYQGHLV